MLPAPRYAMEYVVVVRRPGRDSKQLESQRILSRSQNLSRSGIGLKLLDEPQFDVGERIILEFDFEDRPEPLSMDPLHLEAEVVWQDDRQCGVQILESGERSHKFYDSLIDGYEVLLNSITPNTDYDG